MHAHLRVVCRAVECEEHQHMQNNRVKKQRLYVTRSIGAATCCVGIGDTAYKTSGTEGRTRTRGKYTAVVLSSKPQTPATVI